MKEEEQEVSIRIARKEDAGKLLAIYAPYVEQTAITFEYEVPTETEFQRRISTTLEKYPYLVAETEGELVGYAYAGEFKNRAAYDWAVELSVYVKQEQRRGGIGRLLYQHLETYLKKQNITNLNACIAKTEKEDAYLTNDSIWFHQHLGYQMVGTFHQCGYKFHRWYDMVWMEKMIGDHVLEQPEVIPFYQLAGIHNEFE